MRPTVVDDVKIGRVLGPKYSRS